MKLSIKDRLVFKLLYPQEGNLITQTLVRDISEKIKITQEEMKNLKLESSGDMVKWDETNDKGLEVEFTQLEINLLRDRVKELDSKNKITQENLDLCVKIKESNDKKKE